MNPSTNLISRPTIPSAVSGDGLAAASGQQQPTANDLLAEQHYMDMLEYHRTHRPKNTKRAYAPKQREWRVGNASPPSLFCLDRPLILLSRNGVTR